METHKPYILTSKFIITTLASLVWIALPGGIFFTLRGDGDSMMGPILAAIGVLLLAVLINGRLMRSMEGRRIDKNRAISMIMGSGFSVLIILVYLVISASTIQSNLLFPSIYVSGAVILNGLSTWLLLSSKQQSS